MKKFLYLHTRQYGLQPVIGLFTVISQQTTTTTKTSPTNDNGFSWFSTSRHFIIFGCHSFATAMSQSWTILTLLLHYDLSFDLVTTENGLLKFREVKRACWCSINVPATSVWTFLRPPPNRIGCALPMPREVNIYQLSYTEPRLQNLYL